jgi:hypothetical protein
MCPHSRDGVEQLIVEAIAFHIDGLREEVLPPPSPRASPEVSRSTWSLAVSGGRFLACEQIFNRDTESIPERNLFLPLIDSYRLVFVARFFQNKDAPSGDVHNPIHFNA